MANSNEMSSRRRRLRRSMTDSARRSGAACPASGTGARILDDARRLNSQARMAMVADARDRINNPAYELDRDFTAAMRILISREF